MNLEQKVHGLMEEDDQLLDPYSAAVVGIKGSLSYGLEHDGAMSVHERNVLLVIQNTLFGLDPLANPDYLSIPNEEEE